MILDKASFAKLFGERGLTPTFEVIWDFSDYSDDQFDVTIDVLAWFPDDKTFRYCDWMNGGHDITDWSESNVSDDLDDFIYECTDIDSVLEFIENDTAIAEISEEKIELFNKWRNSKGL